MTTVASVTDLLWDAEWSEDDDGQWLPPYAEEDASPRAEREALRELADAGDHPGLAFALKQAGDSDGDDELMAWFVFYGQEGEGWDGVRYCGTFKDDIEFTKAQVADLADIPDWVVVDYEATSNIVSDYVEVDLPGGRKAYFR